MKRSRGEGEIECLTMAKCLMLLSRGGEIDLMTRSPSRVFQCKTCNRQFSSFQALGGHRASHKKPRLIGEDPNQLQNSPVKPKTHECSICGLEFAIGQALGGHMRRHRATMIDGLSSGLPPRQVPVVKKSAFWLDLNLTPMEENDLDLKLGKTAPMIDFFI
ncbi:hypothetical protein HHK36_019009 [Tetracentron sinense]|uniref:C2H2-type domain-containing protein n=1 Tax=Tetracentron sinense TaxID=13715 RepID=A0A834YT98_TETSI|nr:hypothetical protein HHK36_019009 [Tetracentron sinense]